MFTDTGFKLIPRLQIPVADVSETDLLSTWFDTAFNFIEESLNNGGKILIHCYHGVSRSATILAAYVLKARLQGNQNTHINNGACTVEDVLSFIKSRRAIACPNEGFMAQLNLWRAMNCRIDPLFKPYKMYQLNCISQQMIATKIMPSNVKSFFQVNREYICHLNTFKNVSITNQAQYHMYFYNISR